PTELPTHKTVARVQLRSNRSPKTSAKANPSRPRCASVFMPGRARSVYSGRVARGQFRDAAVHHPCGKSIRRKGIGAVLVDDDGVVGVNLVRRSEDDAPSGGVQFTALFQLAVGEEVADA